MKRKMIGILIAVCILSGCGDDKMHTASTENVSVTDNRKEINTMQNDEKEEEDTIANLEEICSKFEHVINVEYVSNDKLLVVADQMYLIDISSGEIIACTSECDYVKEAIRIYSNEENIIIVGKEWRDCGNQDVVFWDDEDAPKQCVLYYDYQLNLVDNINIYETFELDPSYVDDVAVSKSGKIAVYDECRGLYLCDTETKKKKKILGDNSSELIYDNKLQFTISGGIEFAQNDKRIVFQADCMNYPASEMERGCCGIGSVTIDGKKYFVEKAGDEYSELESFDKYAILSQDCGFTSPTGEVIKYIFDTDSTETIELKAKEESESLYCSQRGNIIATSEENGDKGWNIRFYDAETGKVLREESCDRVSSKKYREPKIYVFEELNVAILLFQSEDGKSKDKFVVMQI